MTAPLSDQIHTVNVAIMRWDLTLEQRPSVTDQSAAKLARTQRTTQQAARTAVDLAMFYTAALRLNPGMFNQVDAAADDAAGRLNMAAMSGRGGSQEYGQLKLATQVLPSQSQHQATFGAPIQGTADTAMYAAFVANAFPAIARPIDQVVTSQQWQQGIGNPVPGGGTAATLQTFTELGQRLHKQFGDRFPNKLPMSLTTDDLNAVLVLQREAARGVLPVVPQPTSRNGQLGEPFSVAAVLVAQAHEVRAGIDDPTVTATAAGPDLDQMAQDIRTAQAAVLERVAEETGDVFNASRASPQLIDRQWGRLVDRCQREPSFLQNRGITEAPRPVALSSYGVQAESGTRGAA